MIKRRALDDCKHLSFGKMQLVRSTSSAYIAVDGRKHYLHYKHFSTAETESLDENWQILLFFVCLFVCFFKKHSITSVLCNQIVFDVTPPKPKKSKQVESKQATISFA